MTCELTFEGLKEAFAGQALFEDKTWRISPQAWPLTRKQVREVELRAARARGERDAVGGDRRRQTGRLVCLDVVDDVFE